MNFSKIFIILSTLISLNSFANDGMSLMHHNHDSCSYIHCPHTCGHTNGCEWVGGRHGGGYCVESYNRYDYCADISCPNRCENTNGCHWSHRRDRCTSNHHHHR